MIRLLCIIEVADARTQEEAIRELDNFRESVQPNYYGLTIYQATAEDPQALREEAL